MEIKCDFSLGLPKKTYLDLKTDKGFEETNPAKWVPLCGGTKFQVYPNLIQGLRKDIGTIDALMGEMVRYGPVGGLSLKNLYFDADVRFVRTDLDPGLRGMKAVQTVTPAHTYVRIPADAPVFGQTPVRGECTVEIKDRRVVFCVPWYDMDRGQVEDMVADVRRRVAACTSADELLHLFTGPVGPRRGNGVCPVCGDILYLDDMGKPYCRSCNDLREKIALGEDYITNGPEGAPFIDPDNRRGRPQACSDIEGLLKRLHVHGGDGPDPDFEYVMDVLHANRTVREGSYHYYRMMVRNGFSIGRSRVAVAAVSVYLTYLDHRCPRTVRFLTEILGISEKMFNEILSEAYALVRRRPFMARHYVDLHIRSLGRDDVLRHRTAVVDVIDGWGDGYTTEEGALVAAAAAILKVCRDRGLPVSVEELASLAGVSENTLRAFLRRRP